MNQEIAELAARVHKGTFDAYAEIEDVRLVLINMKISMARMKDAPEPFAGDARALNSVTQIVEKAMLQLEERMLRVRAAAKRIEDLNSTL